MSFNKLGFIALLLVLLASCTTPITPVFTFSPEMPKAGETVTFTNATVDGTNYDWNFGDERTSIATNPTHVYKDPGIYTVTLRVDSNDNFVASQVVTVYDTIPSVYITEDKIDYYATVHFNVLAYNPYAYDATYAWTFSENAVSDSIHDGVATCKEVPVYFVQRNVNEIVHLEITIGDSVYNVVDTFYVNDVPARSILMTQPNGKVLRQRLFENGIEEYTETSIPSGDHAFTMDAMENKLYIFEAGAVFADPLSSVAGEGKIRKIDMSDNSSSVIIENHGSNLNNFYNGYVNEDYILWTDYNNFIYKADLNDSLGSFTYSGYDEQVNVPYYLVKADRLGYYGNGLEKDQINGSVAYYDGMYFWAKGGTGKGIYLFEADDILDTNVLTKGDAPDAGAILTEYAIRAFSIDPINQRIYFSVTAPSDKVGLWVARINGSSPVRIDDSPMSDENTYMTDIEVDNESNYVYWSYICPTGLNEAYFAEHPTHRTGVKRMKLLSNYSSIFDIDYLNVGTDVYGLAIDDIEK